MSEKLNIGDRIEVGGGYDMEPVWLNGKQHYSGTVKKFIPGQNETPAAVIELDDKISFQEVNGNTLILELRYVGAEWKDKETVHVELCDFEPEEKAWQDRIRGKWWNRMQVIRRSNRKSGKSFEYAHRELRVLARAAQFKDYVAEANRWILSWLEICRDLPPHSKESARRL